MGIKQYFSKKENKVLTAGIGTELALTGANIGVFYSLQEKFNEWGREYFFKNYQVLNTNTEQIISDKTSEYKGIYLIATIGFQALVLAGFGISYLGLKIKNKKLKKQMNQGLVKLMVDEKVPKEDSSILE